MRPSAHLAGTADRQVGKDGPSKAETYSVRTTWEGDSAEQSPGSLSLSTTPKVCMGVLGTDREGICGGGAAEQKVSWDSGTQACIQGWPLASDL